jgi:signal transduction histidine kinase/CheY-like chemotaxis protein
LLRDHQHYPDTEPSLRAAAIGIFGAAVAACIVLFGVVMAFAAADNAYTFAALLFGGTIVIVATALFRWQTVSETRIESLLSHMRTAERDRDDAVMARSENERMLATMSHEIRTPLNGVVGMHNLLLETNLSAEQKNYLQTADASGRVLLSIIDEILDTAKGRATRDPHKSHCNIRATLESVTELLAARAHAKGLDVSSHVTPSVPDVVAMEDTHLRQILFNIAGNAIKFTEKGGVAIEADWSVSQGLLLSIADSGIGVDDAEALLIFDDYKQANTHVTGKFGGTGLGLGIARRIVLSLGGRIEVKSTPGEGTVFKLTLPLAVEARAPDVADQSLLGQHFKLAMTNGVSRRHLTRSLEDMGALVDHIVSSTELRATLKSKSGTSILIADTSHGVLLRHWAKSQRRFPDGHIQVWTMLTPEERRDYHDFLKAPFSGYLLRPTRRSTLSSLLSKHQHHNVAQAVQKLRSMLHEAQPAKSLRVLLVDDSPVNLLLARTMLTKAGHRVTTATDGLAALHLYKSQATFDLMLLDVEMPGLDGYDTARQLRAREAAENLLALPIIALTAHVRQQDLDHCLTCGMNGYLTKPFDQHDLAEAIGKMGLQDAA